METERASKNTQTSQEIQRKKIKSLSLPAVPALQRRGANSIHPEGSPLTSIAQTKANNAPAVTAQLVQSKSTPGVIQLITDKELKDLLGFVKNNDQDGFSTLFRGIDKGQDEWISCKLTFDRARLLLSEGKETEVKELLTTSSDLRFPTSHMGHNIGDSHVIHPTSPDTLPYDAPQTAKGNPRWLKHTGTDRDRRDYVSEGTSVPDMSARAIEYSTRVWVQPPFAQNSKMKLDVNDPANRAAHERREANKQRHPSYNPHAQQRFDAPWIPQSRTTLKRSVSAARILPPISSPSSSVSHSTISALSPYSMSSSHQVSSFSPTYGPSSAPTPSLPGVSSLLSMQGQQASIGYSSPQMHSPPPAPYQPALPSFSTMQGQAPTPSSSSMQQDDDMTSSSMQQDDDMASSSMQQDDDMASSSMQQDDDMASSLMQQDDDPPPQYGSPFWHQ